MDLNFERKAGWRPAPSPAIVNLGDWQAQEMAALRELAQQQEKRIAELEEQAAAADRLSQQLLASEMRSAALLEACQEAAAWFNARHLVTGSFLWKLRALLRDAISEAQNEDEPPAALVAQALTYPGFRGLTGPLLVGDDQAVAWDTILYRAPGDWRHFRAGTPMAVLCEAGRWLQSREHEEATDD